MQESSWRDSLWRNKWSVLNEPPKRQASTHVGPLTSLWLYRCFLLSSSSNHRLFLSYSFSSLLCLSILESRCARTHKLLMKSIGLFFQAESRKQPSRSRLQKNTCKRNDAADCPARLTLTAPKDKLLISEEPCVQEQNTRGFDSVVREDSGKHNRKTPRDKKPNDDTSLFMERD